MSLVGTRPPTVDEWDKYELHHRARLATKPGLTGMWQVSGRSNITDLMNLRILDLERPFCSFVFVSVFYGYQRQTEHMGCPVHGRILLSLQECILHLAV